MRHQKFIRSSLYVSGFFNIAAALIVAFPHSAGSFAQLPAAGSLFHSLLTALLIFIFGIIYFRMAVSQQIDVPLVTIAGFGKAAVFCIALYCYLTGVISFSAFSLAVGDLLFAFVFLGWVIFYRNK